MVLEGGSKEYWFLTDWIEHILRFKVWIQICSIWYWSLNSVDADGLSYVGMKQNCGFQKKSLKIVVI